MEWKNLQGGIDPFVVLEHVNKEVGDLSLALSRGRVDMVVGSEGREFIISAFKPAVLDAIIDRLDIVEGGISSMQEGGIDV